MADHHAVADIGNRSRRLTADTGGLGYLGAALVFAALLALVAGLSLWPRINGVMLFWVAFILTRALGAVVGDFLDKPHDHGGLALSRPLASLVLAVLILGLLVLLPQKAGRHPGQASMSVT